MKDAHKPTPTQMPNGKNLRKHTAEQIASLAPLVHAHTTHVWRTVGLRTPAQSVIVKVLSYHPMSQTMLQRVLGISAPTLSKQVTSLEADGLVLRKVDSEDRRNVTVSLTEQGRALAKAAKAREVNEISTLIDSLSDYEIEQVSQALQLIANLYDTRAAHHRCARNVAHHPNNRSTEGNNS